MFTDKQLKPVDLRLGITDGTNTELLDGESLSVDTQVVTGMTGLATARTGDSGGGTAIRSSRAGAGAAGRGGRGGLLADDVHRHLGQEPRQDLRRRRGRGAGRFAA